MQNFSKGSRLYLRSDISNLFEKGDTLMCYPFKFIYVSTPLITESNNCSILISVGKRSFKRANIRNLIKRRIRESYRLNHSAFSTYLDSISMHVNLGVVYVAKEVLPHTQIQAGLIKGLGLLIKKIGIKHV